MGQGWAKGLLPKVHQEVGIQPQPSVYCVYINLQHHGAFPGGNREGEERSEHGGHDLVSAHAGGFLGAQQGLYGGGRWGAFRKTHVLPPPLMWERRAGEGIPGCLHLT